MIDGVFVVWVLGWSSGPDFAVRLLFRGVGVGVELPFLRATNRAVALVW